MLVVQIVEILWSKASRGMPLSKVRADLPRAFAIEPFEEPYVIQHVRLAEWEHFSAHTFKLESKASAPRIEGGLCIQPAESDSFHLGLIGNPSAGKPHRHPVNRALTLKPGEFARLVINGRHTSYSGQWYSEYVYNVANGPSISANRFLAGEPDHKLDLCANLF